MKRHLFVVVILFSVFFLTGLFFLCNTPQKKSDDSSYNHAFGTNNALFSPPIPDSLTFAGESVPLDLYYVKEALDRELLVNTYWQSNVLLYVKRAHRWFPVIEPILKENNIPEDFKYLAVIESGLMNVVSPAKAAGFWQFLKTTGIHYGLEVTDEIDERYHLEKATLAACKYLQNSYLNFGSWTAAAAAYNMGDAGFKRVSTTQKISSYWDLHLNQETSRYVYRMLAVKTIFENPEKYGIKLRMKDLYQPIPTHKLTIDSAISNLSEFAIRQGINYKLLKEFNPWLLTNTLTNKAKKTYIISIPQKEYLSYEKQREKIEQQKLYSGE